MAKKSGLGSSKRYLMQVLRRQLANHARPG
jgi:hypothetical protein